MGPFHRVVENIAHIVPDQEVLALSTLTLEELRSSERNGRLERNTGHGVRLLSLKSRVDVATAP